MPTTVTRILGFAREPDLAEQLHRIDHEGGVEYLPLKQQDVHRRRLRGVTDRGTEFLVALPRDQPLGDGAILMLEEDQAIVVRLAEERWLGLVPRDAAAAMELGYFAGNLHWRVRFDGPKLLIVLEWPEDEYLERLEPFFSDGRVRRDDE